MKPWTKVLMWLGLGFGTGIFAGIQIGRRMEKNPDIPETPTVAPVEPPTDQLIQNYISTNYLREEVDTNKKDPVDMTQEELHEELALPEELPELHPSHMEIEIVSEAIYYENPYDLDEEKLLYFEGDDVLYNCTTQSVIEDRDDVIGFGTLHEFRPNPHVVKDTIFVFNRTYARYRIDRMDDAFADAVDGTIHPDDDDVDDDGDEADYD